MNFWVGIMVVDLLVCLKIDAVFGVCKLLGNQEKFGYGCTRGQSNYFISSSGRDIESLSQKTEM